jgi:hypothetical protein
MIWYDIRYDTIRYDIWYDLLWYDMIYDMIWYICYDMVWYDIWYDTILYLIWYGAIRCDMIYDTMRYDRIGYDMIWYDMIYLTAIGLTTVGSSTVHIYTQTIQFIRSHYILDTWGYKHTLILYNTCRLLSHYNSGYTNAPQMLCYTCIVLYCIVHCVISVATKMLCWR